ncbi:hypothetical protein J27TS8_23230 [Robertmurraya siralis]|uniref:Uncharacterized protein n=1 Tax=Robertmurraya siralis TaxID=77777 RepID=A0A920BTM8_9BACI|nr:hypothetical protein [Robertmurraya siralis]GIN62330.1 hypothetical protein J27TS8_23230 [Robertmurraya siralis]
MFNLLIVLGMIVCIWQFFLVKKRKARTSLFIAILSGVIVVLMILGMLAVLKSFVIVIAIILSILFMWALIKR